MIEPVGDRLLIKPEDIEDKSKEGLLLTKLEEDKQDQGIIIEVGDGQEVKRFKKGDKIIFQKYGPAEIFIKKEKHVIVYIDEILAVSK